MMSLAIAGAVVAVILILMLTAPENDEAPVEPPQELTEENEAEAPAETADRPTGETLDAGPLNE
jgi:hypothetical protein